MASSNVKKAVAEKTGTNVRDWQYIDGPTTGVGIEFWLHNNKTGVTVYYCDDQGNVSISVSE